MTGIALRQRCQDSAGINPSQNEKHEHDGNRQAKDESDSPAFRRLGRAAVRFDENSPRDKPVVKAIGRDQAFVEHTFAN